MSFRTTLFAGVITVLSAATAFAGEIELHSAYARSSSPNAKAGAAFMMVHNHTKLDDRLIGASSPVAAKVELHTHVEDANGVMKMMHVEEGFDLPANSRITLKRGGDHVMFMGLTESFEQGKKIPLTLIFEKAGEVTYEIEVDLEREDGHGAGHDHGSGS